MPVPAPEAEGKATQAIMSMHNMLQQQAAWLAPMRARLLRRVSIVQRRHVLDLGTGSGAVTEELVRRCRGRVTALDYDLASLLAAEEPFAGARRVCGHAGRLPFGDSSFDLVFTQCALLWMKPLRKVMREIWRVLQPGGALVALEPDYGGMIEYPPAIATRDLWLRALTRAGADPLIGRKLPGLLAAWDFEVRVDLLPELLPPALERFAFLRTLPLTWSEQDVLQRIEQRAATLTSPWEQVAHLPFVLITATRCA